MRRAGLAFSLLLLAVFGGCQEAPRPGSGPGGIFTGPGLQIRIAMMPKKMGIEYFNACRKGAEEAARELGDVELFYDGPLSDRSEDQSRLVDMWVLRGYQAILIACNDPDQIAPALKRARDKGVHVLTYDADANPRTSGREFFVNQATVQGIAEALVDEMVRQAGPEAQVAIVTSSLTAPNQNAWLAAMERYRQQRYPNLKILDKRPSEEDQQKAITEAQNILKAHPACKGIFGMSSVAFPGVAQAVEQQGQAGRVAVVGLSTPKTMRPYVERGVVKSVILWNPVDLGYLSIYAARAAALGELKPGATSFTAGRLKSVEVSDNVILLGKPMLFDRSNIARFDF